MSVEAQPDVESEHMLDLIVGANSLVDSHLDRISLVQNEVINLQP